MEGTFITPIQPLNLNGKITPLEPVKRLSELQGTDASSRVEGAEGISAFKSIFEEKINEVRTTEDALAKQQYLLATGQTENPHSVGIASWKAQLAVDSLVSLRTKALEAYNEIMRISL